MSGRLAALAASIVVLAATSAGAQTSTLTPFGWSASVSLGTSAGLRPLSDARAQIVLTNATIQVTSPAVFDPSDPTTAEPLDARLSAQLGRDVGGIPAHYKLTSDRGTLPIFFLDGGVRQVSLPVAEFDAPLTGDLRQTVSVPGLCSMIFHVEAVGAQKPFGGLFVSFEAEPEVGTGSFGAIGPPLAGSDPTGLPGYVAVTENGHPTALAEVLVSPSATYRARGTVIIDGVSIAFQSTDTYALDAACQPVSGQPPSSAAPPGVSVNGSTVGSLSGSLYLAPDSLAGTDAPWIGAYAMQAVDPATLTTQLVDLPGATDAPMPYSMQLRAQAWLLSPRIGVQWPDGRLEQLEAPHVVTDDRWSPPMPLPLTPTSPRLGVYPDASVYLSSGEQEIADFHAPMAYVQGRIVPRGCALPSDIVDGAVSFEGLPDGAETKWHDERGRELWGYTGNDHGSGRTPLVAGTGDYEFVGTPGPWLETDARVVFSRSSPSAADGFSGDVQLVYRGPSLDLPTRRATAPQVLHDLPLGAVTITLRVRNEDGTFRPFRRPGAHISTGTFSEQASGIAGTFLASANTDGDLATEHHVRVLAPPGVWDIEGTAEVPQNPDGSGPTTVAPFPLIHRVPFRPPRADGSCDAICLDAQTGEYVGDDLKAPALTLAAAPPARTSAATLTLAGRVTDESPIESVTVNGVAATLTADDAGADFTLTLPLAEGENTLEIAATDRCGEVRSASYTVRRVVNHPPKLYPVGDRTVAEGDVLTVAIGAEDRDGDTLTYRLEGDTLPSHGPVVDPSTGLVLWATDFASEGVYPVTYVVSDGELETREEATITVTHVNEPPVILSIGGRYAHSGEPLRFRVAETEPLALEILAVDGDDDPLEISVVPRESVPARGWSTADGLFSWTPTYGDAGTYVLEATARDPADASDTVEFVVEVAPTNRDPRIRDDRAHLVDEGEQLAFTIAGSDPDGDPLTWSFEGDGRALPATLTTTPSEAGLDVVWTVEFTAAGMWPYVVRVDDGRGGHAEAHGIIVVRDVNRPPEFEPVPDQYPAGFPGAFSYVVTDPDGDPLTCDVLELPPGATFDPFAREVRWPELPAESRYVARIRCSDGAESAELDVNVVNSWGAFAGGCGCGTGGVASGVWLLGLALARRRRR